jgi:cytochrome c-type biogenesis protein CcmH/NrfG
VTPEARTELEEERDFLLRSLEDLERERAAGDVADTDYITLRDGYTSRAAAVLRRLAADDDAASVTAAPYRTRRRGSLLAWVVIVVSVAVVSGWLVARFSGERLPGQIASGNIESDSVSGLLSDARQRLAPNDPEPAMQLYAQVLELEPDNVEALTYLGWLSALSARSIEDDEEATQRFQTGLVLLRQATTIDETYADPHCFLGVLFFRFLGDTEAAEPELQTCLDLDPPAEARGLVEAALADLQAQTSGGEDTVVPADSVAPG